MEPRLRRGRVRFFPGGFDMDPKQGIFPGGGGESDFRSSNAAAGPRAGSGRSGAFGRLQSMWT